MLAILPYSTVCNCTAEQSCRSCNGAILCHPQYSAASNNCELCDIPIRLSYSEIFVQSKFEFNVRILDVTCIFKMKQRLNEMYI